MPYPVYTIGHSNHPIARFLSLLKQHGIEALIDVRSVPMSRFNPQFRQKNLQASLEAAGIRYVYLGERLGGLSRTDREQHAARIPYEKRVRLPEFQSGMAELKRLAGVQHVAIVCAEKDPLNCHRMLLVARALAEEDIPVQHILADGSLRTQEEVENAMMEWLGIPESDLFHARDARVAEAYCKRSGAGTYKEIKKAG